MERERERDGWREREKQRRGEKHHILDILHLKVVRAL
jgi:hypothetical protein